MKILVSTIRDKKEIQLPDLGIEKKVKLNKENTVFPGKYPF
jgi:hypothetical protein